MHMGTVLRIQGTFDAFTAPDLQPTIDQLAARPGARVIVDVSALRLIDTWGVRAILSLHTRLAASGGRLRLVGLHGQPLTLLRLLRLDGVLMQGIAEANGDAAPGLGDHTRAGPENRAT